MLPCRQQSTFVCYGAGGPVLIHSNVGDLLHSLESPGPVVFISPKLVALNREGNIVVSYEKGGICLFTINGKLLCDIKHSESVQVVYDVQSLLSLCLLMINYIFHQMVEKLNLVTH